MQVGSWQKICDLGSGAFGVVSLWKNKVNDDCTAIKMCRFKTNNILTEKQKERWNNEVDIMKIINHSNIIKYKTIPEDLQEFLMKNNPTGLPLLPMEYCRKGNLRHVLLRPQNISGMEEDDVRCILEDISKGLQHLHNLKITHRDVKPDNIVLQHCDNRKNDTVYKIIDLGYAKELGDTVVSFVGTLHYLAPEIFETQKYNNSVDYWSMGILTFELICGVLPFLPTKTPFERFEKIKKKGPEDICIYLNYSGQITYSPEIKKENLISTCLKQNIEVWLRHVLTYDQNIRSQNFPDNTRTLDYLNSILKKTIVNVFSLCRLEFYSYEITECTQIGTLKDWISRDIKVPKTDLLLLISNEAFNVQDNDLLLNVLKDTTYIYVTAKHFLPEKITYNNPKLIREVMKSALKFNLEFLKPLKSQLIYFITIEKTTAYHFKTSFHLYLNFLYHIINKIKNLKTITISKVNQLVNKIDCYNKIKVQNIGDIDLRYNNEYRACLNHAQRLIASFERSVSNFAQFDKKIKCVSNRIKVLYSVTEKIKIIVESYNMEEEYKKVLMLIEKSNVTNATQVNQVISNTTKLISGIIRVKERVFRNKELKAFSSAIGVIMCHCFELKKWIQEYNIHNEELLQSFEQNKAAHFDILFKAAASKPKSDTESISDQSSLSGSLAQELFSLPTPYLIHQNQDLRYKFEEILSLGISGDANCLDQLS